MSILFVVLFIIIIVVVGATTQKKGKIEKVTELKPVQKDSFTAKNLMTNNEFEFFNRLIEAFPDYYIFPQVAMSGLVDAKTIAFRNSFNRARIDFVLYKDKKVVAIIELDDKTHKGKEEQDEKRDSILSQAGYKTFRFISTNKPSLEELRRTIRGI